MRYPTSRCVLGLRSSCAGSALLSILLGLAACGSAHAQSTDVFCISSAADLQAKRATIQSVERNGNALDLRFQSGYYDVSAVGATEVLRIQRNHLPDVSVKVHRISGGWNPGCSQQASTQDASSSTVLDARGQKPILSFMQVRGNMFTFPSGSRVSLRIDQLQFADSSGRCLEISHQPSEGYAWAHLDVSIERSRFELCRPVEAVASPVYVRVEGNITLRNSVFVLNRSNTVGAFRIHAVDGTVAVYNNTFRHNEATNAEVGATAYAAGNFVYFQNNLIADGFYFGVMRDLWIHQGAAFVRNNRMLGSIVQGQPDVLVVSGTVTDPPGFINAQSPRLAASSAMRDRGLLTVPAPGYGTVDYEGQPRVQGAAPEIGAFELPPTAAQEVVFANGFELN